MPPAVAIAGITAAAGIGGSVIASNGAKSAANKAAAAQTAADQAAIAEQRRQYDQTRTDFAPWMQQGQSAAGAQGDLLGLNGPEAQQAAITAQQSSPLYESLFRNGENTLLQNASATGGLRGGNTQGALANFGKDALAQVIEAQLTRLGGVSEQGQNAAAGVASAGANSANAISQLLTNSGAAQAGAATAAGGANAALVKGITGSLTGLANNQAVVDWAGKLF